MRRFFVFKPAAVIFVFLIFSSFQDAAESMNRAATRVAARTREQAMEGMISSSSLSPEQKDKLPSFVKWKSYDGADYPYCGCYENDGDKMKTCPVWLEFARSLQVKYYGTNRLVACIKNYYDYSCEKNERMMRWYKGEIIEMVVSILLSNGRSVSRLEESGVSYYGG